MNGSWLVYSRCSSLGDRFRRVILTAVRSAEAAAILLTGPLAGALALIPQPTWRSGRIELAITPGVGAHR